jgi:hypothetical protein
VLGRVHLLEMAHQAFVAAKKNAPGIPSHCSLRFPGPARMAAQALCDETDVSLISAQARRAVPTEGRICVVGRMDRWFALGAAGCEPPRRRQNRAIPLTVTLLAGPGRDRNSASKTRGSYRLVSIASLFSIARRTMCSMTSLSDI